MDCIRNIINYFKKLIKQSESITPIMTEDIETEPISFDMDNIYTEKSINHNDSNRYFAVF